jgi:2-aminoadipate transaminase
MSSGAERFLSAAALRVPAPPRTDAPTLVRFNFDAGWPAPETFPLDAFRRLAPEVLGDPAALGYASVDVDDTGATVYAGPGTTGSAEMTMGLHPLRAQIAEWVARRQDVSGLGPENVILTSGSTQAIALAVTAFVDPGEGALVEALTFAYAFRSLRLRDAEIRMVDIDDDGLMPDALEAQLDRLRRDGVRPKLLYVIPTFHLPTGSVLPLDRRRRLLEIAEEWDLIVVEDAIYSDLRYEGDPVPSLLSLDRSGRVLQAHAFSKLLATGLRIGWMSGERELVEALGRVREDLGVSQWLSRVVSAFIAEGGLDRQIARIVEIYRDRRDRTVSLLREHCGELVAFAVPQGGWYLWIRVHETVDWAEAQRRAAAAGVVIREARRFIFTGQAEGPPCFRFSYAHASADELSHGIALLGEALRGSVRARQDRIR